MKPVKISNQTARKIILNCQGLNRSIDDTSKIFEELSYVQIDTISVIERAHNHVLFSRNPNYKKEDLDGLISNGNIFEYWSHAAAYLPMSDFNYSLYLKNLYATGRKHWFEKDKKMMRRVLKRIKEEGPLQSKDFEGGDAYKHPWGSVKPGKIALIELFMEGKLMISGRSGFQKIYDLSERVVPDIHEIRKPTKKQFIRYLIDRAIRAQGIISQKQISYLRTGMHNDVKQELKKMVSNKEILEVEVEGLEETYYSFSDLLNQNLEIKSEVRLLSPFDNLVIQRQRMNSIFNYDYLIECYVPQAKRKYGYYCLPILYGDQFVGRLDPKADRATKTFIVKQIWFEEHFKEDDKFKAKFDEQLTQLASFCGCETIRWD